MNRTYQYLIVAYVAKFFLSTFTPLSADFVQNVLISQLSWRKITTAGLFYAPWYSFMKGVTQLWLILPLEHRNLLSMIGFWYFQPNVSIVLLLLMQKTPLLLLDVATAIMIGRIVRQYHSSALARRAMILWLANPFVTLTTEMWGTWDIVSTFLLLFATAAFAKARFLESGLSLGLGIAVKVYSGLALPVFLIFLTRERLTSSLRFVVGTCGAFLVAGVTPMLFADRSAASAYTLSAVATFWGYLTRYSINFYDGQISLLMVALILSALGYFVLWKPNRRSIFEAVTWLYLLVFAFSYWEPHFLLHLIPFLTIFYVVTGLKKLPFITYFSSALVFCLIDFAFYWTSWGHSLFFIPNYNATIQHYSDLFLFIPGWPVGSGTVDSIIITPMRWIFVGISLYYFVWIFLKNSNREALSRLVK